MHKKIIVQVVFLGGLLALSSCGSAPRKENVQYPASPGQYLIPGLSVCKSQEDPRISIDPRKPVVILTHGCSSSAGRYKSLADVFEFHGQQAICYSYNDRDGLVKSAAGLNAAIDSLAHILETDSVTVIGHSQGALVSRRALTSNIHFPGIREEAKIRLVTVSGPFAGIQAASHCGNTLLGILSVGLTFPICKLVTGDKWADINPNATFIRMPGELIPQVWDFVKVVTDERGSCRHADEQGKCIEDDYVFSTQEQYTPVVDSLKLVRNIEVLAGHVEIVGTETKSPTKLIAILQDQGILLQTPVAQRADFQTLLAQLF